MIPYLNIKRFLFSTSVIFCAQFLWAQNFTISLNPTNGSFAPVTVSGKWHTVQSGTTFNPSYSLPETSTEEGKESTVTKSYSFVSYKVGNTQYSESELQSFLSSTKDSEVKITATAKEKTETVSNGGATTKTEEKDVTADAITLALYPTPNLTTNVLANGNSAGWDGAKESFSYSTEGSKWSVDFYYTKDGGSKVNATNNQLEFTLACQSGSSVYVVTLANVKCTAPDGKTDWTPSSVSSTYSHTVTAWAIPTASRESTVEETTYIFNGTTLTLSPNIKNGQSDAWTYTWTTPVGVYTTTDPSFGVSTNSNLQAATTGKKENSISVTATNTPTGVSESKSVTIKYVVNTVPTPLVSLEDDNPAVFSGKPFDLKLTVIDSDPPYYPTGTDSTPSCYYIQGGKKHNLTHQGTSYAGTSDYVGQITPTVSKGEEQITVEWSRCLIYGNKETFHPECQQYVYTKELNLRVCPSPTAGDIDVSGTDEYAIAKVGHVVDLAAEGNPLEFDGSWSYVWSPNNSSGSSSTYNVVESDVKSISGNQTYKKDYFVTATYTLNTKSKASASVQKTFTITFCALPTANTTSGNVTTCVGRDTELGIQYSGGYSDGWTTEWYDENGDLIDDITGAGGMVSFNEDIDQTSVVKHYKVNLVNTYHDKVWYNAPLNFDITLYQRPQISIDKILSGEYTSEINVYGGDSDNVTAKTTGGYPSGWNYSWKFNNKTTTKTGSTSTYSVETNTLSSSSAKKVQALEVRVYNKFNSEIWSDTTYVINYNVWSKGALDTESVITPSYLLGDPNPANSTYWHRSILQMGTLGGYDEGWSFTWTVKDDPANVVVTSDNISTLSIARDSIEVINTTNEIQPVVLTLFASNSIGSNKGNSYTSDFEFKVYPMVNLNMKDEKDRILIDGDTIHQYYGYDRYLTVSASGGYSKFTFKWSTEKNQYTDNKNEETNNSNYNTTYHAGSREADVDTEDTNVTRTLRVTNYGPGNEKWVDRTIHFPFHYWSKGQVSQSKESKGELSVYGGSTNNELILSTVKRGGYSDGYKFNWTISKGIEWVSDSTGKKFEKDTIVGDSYFIIKGQNSSLEDQSVMVDLHWSNSCDGIIGHEGDLSFPITVFPGAIIPERISGWTDCSVDQPEVLRDVEDKTFAITKGQGGYIWKYQWYVDGQPVYPADKFSYKVNISDGSRKMNITYHDVRLDWVCYGPKDSIWEQGTELQYLKVYNTPVRPAILKQKGNGTSNIFIADLDDTGLSDDEMFSSAYDYIVEFGQGNSEVAEAEETTQRWHQYTSAPTNPWTRTLWRYSDGYNCYSDMVDTNGNTRAVTGIESCSVDSILNASIYVFRANGTLVCTLPENGVDLSELASGMYILRNSRTGESTRIYIK